MQLSNYLGDLPFSAAMSKNGAEARDRYIASLEKMVEQQNRLIAAQQDQIGNLQSIKEIQKKINDNQADRIKLLEARLRETKSLVNAAGRMAQDAKAAAINADLTYAGLHAPEQLPFLWKLRSS